MQRHRRIVGVLPLCPGLRAASTPGHSVPLPSSATARAGPASQFATVLAAAQPDVADHLLNAGDIPRVCGDLIQFRPASRYVHQIQDSVYCLDREIDVEDIAVAQHLETQLGRYFWELYTILAIQQLQKARMDTLYLN